MLKLVRDRLPEIDPSMKVSTASEKERVAWLVAKLIEEAIEVSETESRSAAREELGDVWEVFKALVNAFDLEMGAVLAEARSKRRLKGAFDKLLIWNDHE